MLSTDAVEGRAGIHVEAHRGRLADLDAGEIGLLEVGVDPPAIGLDDGEERLAGLDRGAGPQLSHWRRCRRWERWRGSCTRSWVALASWARLL